MVYEKDFVGWGKEKEQINNNTWPHPQVWEIWHCKVWVNVWSEVDGKLAYLRPVVIVSQVGRMYFVAPLTTKEKDTAFYYALQSVDFWLDEQQQPIVSRVLLWQCRIIDNKRLWRKTKKISYPELEHIKKLLYALYLKPYEE